MTDGTMRRGVPVWRIIGWGGAAALLSLPAIAMALRMPGVDWSPFDFIVMGAMMAITGGLIELLVRQKGDLAYRLGAAVAVVTGFLLVWVNLAVGIIGSENNDANWMYAAVLAIAFGGATATRMRPLGMARAMLGAAVAQVSAAAIALIFSLGTDGLIWPRDVIGATGVFTLLWLLAASLFWAASRDR